MDHALAVDCTSTLVRPRFPSRASSAAVLAELELALARQNDELELAFAAFRDLADRGSALPLSEADWDELTGAFSELAGAAPTASPRRAPPASGSTALHFTRC